MSQNDRNQSEVARLLAQIDTEYQAARNGLSGLAQVTRHDFINARVENMEIARQELENLVGLEKATELVVERVLNQERATNMSSNQQKDISPMVPYKRYKRRVHIEEKNDIMKSFDTTVDYESDDLPEWFKPLQPIVEDSVFTSMVINLDTTHYHITIAKRYDNADIREANRQKG